MIVSQLYSDEKLQTNSSIFFDDVLLYSKTLPEMLDLVERVFKIIKNCGLYLHPEKCNFLPAQVQYLGQGFDSKGHFALR